MMSHEEWKNWTAKNYEYLYNFALNKLDDKEIIKDLIQETFLVALQNYESFEKRSSEVTWLAAILKHKIYRVYYCRARRKAVIAVSSDTNPALFANRYGKVSVSAEPYDKIITKEFNQALARHLMTLPISWQRVYELQFVKGLETVTICTELKLSPGNYWVITHRLKSSLKNWYKRHWLEQ